MKVVVSSEYFFEVMKLGILKTGRKEPKKKYTHHTYSAAMYFDAPYDYGLFPHDQQ